VVFAPLNSNTHDTRAKYGKIAQSVKLGFTRIASSLLIAGWACNVNRAYVD